MAKAKKQQRDHGGWQDRLADYGLRGLIWLVGRLPMRPRLSLVSWVVRRLLAPLLRWPARIDANLDHVYPEMPRAERDQIIDRSLDNLARVFIENYDVPALHAQGRKTELTGPGLEAVTEARDAGRPVLFLTAHYGCPERVRATLAVHGFAAGGLYRAMSNPFFNKHYSQNFHAVCGPVFEQGRRGTMGLVKHIRSGGIAVLLFDLFDSAGVPIDFLGKPAPTLTSAADIALRTDALLVPYFGIRNPDGITYQAIIEEPIAHGDPLEMMREATRRLEARIEEDPGQWLWIHRRWKPKRQAKHAKKRAQAEAERST